MINFTNSVVNFDGEISDTLKVSDFKAIPTGRRQILVTLLTYLVILTYEGGWVTANLNSEFVDAMVLQYQKLNRDFGDKYVTKMLEAFRQKVGKEQPNGLQQIGKEIAQEWQDEGGEAEQDREESGEQDEPED